MQEKLQNFISENLLSGSMADGLSPKEDLLSTGLLDSMAMMRLMAFIEEEFGLNIPPEDMVIENFINIEAMVQYLENQPSI